MHTIFLIEYVLVKTMQWELCVSNFRLSGNNKFIVALPYVMNSFTKMMLTRVSD